MPSGACDRMWRRLYLVGISYVSRQVSCKELILESRRLVGDRCLQPCTTEPATLSLTNTTCSLQPWIGRRAATLVLSPTL